MEFLLLIGKWLAAPVVAIVVTLLFGEPLRERLVPLLYRLGSKKEKGIEGFWRATFVAGARPAQTYVEYIEIRARFGILVGTIYPHPENYLALRDVEMSRPVRVRGQVKDNTFFSGQWVHPIRLSHHMGTFDLVISRNNMTMHGLWLGYSETRKAIESQAWQWERADNDFTVASADVANPNS